MTKVWKWIIGIVLALVILAALICAGFMLRGNMHGLRGGAQFFGDFPERGWGLNPYGGFPHMRGPGMMAYRVMPFGGFFGGLLHLGFLALVVLGIYWLVKSLRTPKPVETHVEAAVSTAVVNPCQKCGMPLQDGWKVCPHCGRKI